MTKITQFALFILALSLGILGFEFFYFSKREVKPIIKTSNITSPVLSPSKAAGFTLVTTGDVGLVRSVNYKISINGPKYPFLKTADILKVADLTLVDLEGPLTYNCPITNEGMVFCGDDNNVKGLVYAGVDIVNLANNHILDQGESGVEQTIEILQKEKIDFTGLDNILIKEINGFKIGFLGFNLIGSNLDEQKLVEMFNRASLNADLVIASFHWGDEYTYEPNGAQKKYAHMAIDSGADLIIGHHPHVIQPIEFYKDKLIVYSHGNFVFDQMWSLETRQGIIGKYTFQGSKLVDYQFVPVLIEDYCQPKPLEGTEKLRILEKLLD